MNLGRGFTVPKEKKVVQNGDNWIPATPEKPMLQKPNNPQPEMPNEENWQNLLGIYTGLLQNAAPVEANNRLQQSFNPNEILGPQDGLQNRMQENFNQNSLQHNIQDSSTLRQKFGRLNQNAQNSGEVVVPPQKVNSLAELMGRTTGRRGAPSPNWPTTLQNHVFHAHRGNGGYNLLEMPNGRFSMLDYNLHLPPRLEARESLTATRPVPIGPATPDQQKQSSTYQIIQEPNVLPDKTSTEEKHEAISTLPKENKGIDRNKTPEQKPTKRRKLRPKVVVEGKKPKTTPKNNTPPVKRKNASENAVKTSTPSINVVEVSDVGPTAKSCKRRLNFDFDNLAEKESSGRGFDHNEGSELKFNLNSESRNGDCSTELNCQSINKIPPQDTELLPQATKAFPTSSKNHTLNAIARSLSVRNANRLAAQANSSEPNLDCRRESRVRIMPQLLENLVDITEEQEIKHPHTITLMGSQMWLHGISGTGHRNKDGSNLWQNDAATGKKMNSEDIFHGNSCSTISSITTVEGRRNKNFPVQCSRMHQNGALTDSNSGGQSIISRNLNDKSSCIEINENINSPNHAAVKQRKKAIKHKFLQQVSKNSRRHGSQEDERNLFSIDDITDLMKDLHINNNVKEIVQKTHSALVPYRGEGAIVPYDEFDLVRKRWARPRVDLDPETNRLWNLLMGKEGSESAETMDSDKQKWWEEERNVFRGRVDSFIARMHLVQGDRRFSKWKGSVVDSVIGVFLTQNVSDHLSSSAFMSLAAKFPPKPVTVTQSCCGHGASPSVEHHEVRITYPDGTTYDHEIVKESTEHRAENIVPEKRTALINDYTRRIEEDIISSQNSSASFAFQASGDNRSSTGSNSDAEDGWNFSKNLGYLSVSKQAERIAELQQYQFQFMGSSFPKIPLVGHRQLENPAYRQNPFIFKVPHHQNMSMGLETWEEDVLAYSGKESISSLASTDFEITNGTGLDTGHEKIGQIAESDSFTAIENGRPKFLPSIVDHAILNKIGSQHINGQHLIKKKQEKQETFQQESVFVTGQKIPAEAFSEQRNDNCKHAGDRTGVPTEMGRVHSSSKISSTPTSNIRNRKAEKEKAETVNWDTLRKQVQSKAGRRGRSREATDSLDYEALRNADVREISDTIKERGMNNMLAERIKDFLNRVVQDHERVDLEWLRDVQPDKAKNYLLSIRGLGLKSVECVRLLTLHHLAFPVDTNVGRIAVRLGWVPLQPLPESLQLHLLELYPVLESIQKYLWPRLCKLDQETLYELHYQMITFGKVFCTKREPNCNACPLRGECRHFASAFASARLALPGTEARHIVSSTAPFTANKSSEVIIEPMLPPPSEDNVERGMGITRNSEPLIEEPTTPESPIEVSERDIEEAFYEDPDEIPVIKLNVEEFTTNLQSFMQEQMEMGEGDMSKALVTLSPEFASIPMPKLKHVSRLRTEHQVYELPDSHLLLKGMDRREPDDPSPYLLAIWTPGETADSVQPTESKCSSQEGGGLCNKKSCFSCNSTREAQAQTVRGTILIPCRTAMRGSFPLNGTYFQVNEVFADHESSLNPIDVPRSLIWNLPRRTVFFGTSVSTIFKGMSTEDIQYCFWKGFVCVRGFDKKTRAPRPLKARLHLPASKMDGKEKRVKIT